jgi:hypothetical protein
MEDISSSGRVPDAPRSAQRPRHHQHGTRDALGAGLGRGAGQLHQALPGNAAANRAPGVRGFRQPVSRPYARLPGLRHRLPRHPAHPRHDAGPGPPHRGSWSCRSTRPAGSARRAPSSASSARCSTTRATSASSSDERNRNGAEFTRSHVTPQRPVPRPLPEPGRPRRGRRHRPPGGALHPATKSASTRFTSSPTRTASSAT